MPIRHIDHLLKLAVLFEKLATGGGFYIVFRKGTTGDFYGPFVNEELAQKVSYFSQSVGTSDALVSRRQPFSAYPFRVYFYDDNEIQALKDDPSEMTNVEYTKVNFHPPHIPMHSSWEEFFQDGIFTPERWWQGKIDGKW